MKKLIDIFLIEIPVALFELVHPQSALLIIYIGKYCKNHVKLKEIFGNKCFFLMEFLFINAKYFTHACHLKNL